MQPILREWVSLDEPDREVGRRRNVYYLGGGTGFRALIDFLREMVAVEPLLEIASVHLDVFGERGRVEAHPSTQ